MDNARMSEETTGVVFGVMLSAPGYSSRDPIKHEFSTLGHAMASSRAIHVGAGAHSSKDGLTLVY